MWSRRRNEVHQVWETRKWFALAKKPYLGHHLMKGCSTAAEQAFCLPLVEELRLWRRRRMSLEMGRESDRCGAIAPKSKAGRSHLQSFAAARLRAHRPIRILPAAPSPRGGSNRRCRSAARSIVPARRDHMRAFQPLSGCRYRRLRCRHNPRAPALLPLLFFVPSIDPRLDICATSSSCSRGSSSRQP